MVNLTTKKNPIPEQKPLVRNKNFKEVAFGYSEKTAINEAMRCLQCRTRPCTKGCPVNVRIPDFIAKVAEGDFEAAYQIISETSSLPAVCGRVCPQENQCEGNCVRGIKGESVGIGRLERFVADWHARHSKPEDAPKPAPSNGRKVAIIGSGPAGLACAGDLVKQGFDVTIFEALHKAGGVLVYGIPEFRLPKDIVQREVDKLLAMGVKLVTNAVIGRSISIDELMDEEGFEAVFIASGAGLPQFLNIPGENYLGVYSANEYLTRINLMKAYRDDYDTPFRVAKRVAVVGGGNVAMDAARCAKRMGAEEVYIIYRRSMDELPARKEEVHHAQEEEVIFRLQNNPVQIIGDENGYVQGIECVQMEMGEPDATGRRRPVAKPDSNFVIDCDAVIIAIGTSPNSLIRTTTKGLQANKKGCIDADEKLQTSREGVFAGGDAVTGAATVIKAMGAGKKAAQSIAEYLYAKDNKSNGGTDK
ncbi:MAG: NADPH-dependent glutamate synthase [Oscillospiraceae bacterium]|nr:NADPH-dependent glutamate synthase [Oscillospiraceae bacterium]